MNLSIFLIIISALAAFGEEETKNKTSDVSKLHIIFIVADDAGWNDVSFHGANQIPTPNIDALAYNGVILHRHYVAPTCTPSRTALLTGRYAIREGLQGTPLKSGDVRSLPLDTPLIPNYFRDLGYATHLLGKWHLGYITKENTPANRGFDQFFGYYNGMITYFNHTAKQSVNKTTVLMAHDLHRDTPDNLSVAYDSGYFTNLITDEAEKIIKNNDNNKPLFLEIAHLAVHGSVGDDPFEVRDMAEVDKTFAHIKDIKRRKFADMAKAMDESVGRVVTALSDSGKLQNSIIVFISDNGAPTENLSDYNQGSNYPLRGMKHNLFEGAIRGVACIFSPLIEKKSRVSNEMMHMVDWLPTLYSAAGGNLSELKLKIDGLNQWPTISKGEQSPRNSTLIDIDDEVGEAAILGNHKFIKVIEKKNSGFSGDSGRDPSYPEYDVKNVLNSPVASAIKKLNGTTLPSEEEALKLRKSSTIECSQNRTELQCKDDVCLFDINEDPCETKDLSAESNLSDVIKELKDLIEKYKADAVKKEVKIDPCSYPSYFNNTFMPWVDNNTSPSGDNNCQHPNYPFLSKN